MRTESVTKTRSLIIPRLLACSALTLSSTCERAGRHDVATDSLLTASALESQQAAIEDTLPLDTVPREPDFQDRLGGEYIAHAFESRIGQAPRMGWVVPPGLLLAYEKHVHVALYSADSLLREVSFHGVLGTVQHDSITRLYHVACERRGPLAAYKWPTAVTAPARVLYTSMPLPGRTEAGINNAEPSGPGEYEQVDSILEIRAGTLRHELVLRMRRELPFYSIRAVYDSITRSLLKSVLLLHDSSGAVLAASFRDSTDYLQCDGCTVPSYEEGVAILYRPLNLFVLPGLPHPTLLLDTGTYEGRALSLVTFTPDGDLAEYRIYEYVVNC